MNILFVHDHVLKKDEENKYYSASGIGTKGFFYKYMKDINSDKIELYLRCEKISQKDTSKLSRLNDANVNPMPSKIYRGPIDYFKRNDKIKLEVRNVIKDKDCIIMRLPSVLSSVVYDVNNYKIPTFVELVGCPFDSLWNYGGIKGKLFAPIMYFKTKRIVSKAKYVHYVTNKFLQNRYPTKGKKLACSDVVINNIDEEILKQRIIKINNQNGKKYVLGLVGTLNSNYKGHATCIKALSILSRKYDVELHFLGGGNQQKWINLANKYNIGNKIFFDGVLPSGEPVFKWLDGLDFQLIMSKTEGLPRILIEAMSRASVSIGSNVGGIPELLDSECILRKNDYKALAIKIEELIQNKEKQILLAKRNFEKSKEYEYIKLSEKREEFYKEFLDKECK